MIGIVVVSHSRALADAAVGLAREMVDADTGPNVVVAAGLDETTFGTDATAVSAGIEEVDSPDGVLVLLDLGSAVLSAEMALEFVDPDVAGRVRLSSAPLVEGLVAAVVLAATGADLDAVAAEAEQGLVAKQAHLGDESSAGSGDLSAPAESADEESVTAEVTVSNDHGLHARPAAKVVGLLRSFDARVTLTNLDTGRGPVNAGSLSAVATLDARQGHRVRISATGSEADDAVRAFEELASRAFDDPPAPTVIASSPAQSGSGLDLAMGPALVRRSAVDTAGYEPGDAETETTRSREAVATVRGRLEGLERRTTEASGEDAGAIFAAQTALLDDPDVTELVDQDLATGRSAVEAWSARLGAVAAGFEALADPYQRERAADVRSVQGSVLRALVGETEPDDGADAAGPGHPVVLLVDELDAATAASIDVERVAGVAVVARGDTGHGVIIASSRGIPLITGVGKDADDVGNGQVVAFSRGEFWAHPSEEDVLRWPERVAERSRERVELVEAAREPAATSDGVRVPVLANVASVADAESAAANGADGSGLVRTEVLFGERTTPPSAEEQTRAFLALAEAMDGKPLTIRTWDIGGDKPLPFLPMAPEANPFLGVRGIRAFALGPPEAPDTGLLHDQLVAVCRAARETAVRVMFPMVTNAAEVRHALAALDHAAGDGGRPDGLEVGIMIEVPAAAMAVDLITDGLDFVSIGTNDLTQYATATDRGNDAVADLADPLNPGVIRLIDQVCRTRPDGLEVAVCGDLASRPQWTALLLGLGVDELSCTSPRVPEVKAVVRRTDRSEARSMAQRVLGSGDRGEIVELMSMAQLNH